MAGLPGTAGPAEQRFHLGELFPEFLVTRRRKPPDKNALAAITQAPGRALSMRRNAVDLIARMSRRMAQHATQVTNGWVLERMGAHG